MTGGVLGDKIHVDMAKVLKKTGSLFKALLDVLLPPVCYVCRESCSGKYGLCEVCIAKIRYIPYPHCLKCGRRLANKETLCRECASKKSPLERGWSCCYYEGTIKECIHLFKYNRYIGLIDVFRDIAVNFIRKNNIAKKVDLIVPVPLHPAKRRGRPYNHAEVFASSVAKVIAIPADLKNLKKIKWTESQSELNKDKRLENVKESFLAVDKNSFSGRNVLLVDDVYTTGATINECAKALLDANANKVFSLTLARGV